VERAADSGFDVERTNDQLALEHSIDDYYSASPLPVRLIERRRLGIIRAMMGETAGLEVAEVGSGGGHILRMFPEAKLTAIDVSEVYLEQARRNLRGYDVRFLKGELDDLGIEPGAFDRIVCSEVLEHTVDPAHILAGIARLLRPEGVAVITVPNDPLIIRVKQVVRHSPVGWALGERVNWGGDEYHLHRWAPPEFRELLERFLTVTEYRPSPAKGMPIRACFRCVRRD
jgi:2-polyprenyl-3-methyl-5-hydroxy-6-metoxy-1,4-benzoquinol methylase